ncbi:MAG: leucine dehydrogenase, partial [Planctomycetota bacterium]
MHILESMVQHGHERISFTNDPATGLRAIIAIHSTVLGNALGGTRR